MKMSGAVNIRINQAEGDIVDVLRQKGVTQADIFRRGLEAYEREIIREVDITKEKS